VEACRLRSELAARDGALVPLILSDVRNFPLYRLAVERVITVNTTAAGGNATLIMLGA
jgi:RHH-type proline utilization regulon transcriptional repressor/proline dehydrogenase/delta 1-pyrroline-5-carboxylate dehydrogenase